MDPRCYSSPSFGRNGGAGECGRLKLRLQGQIRAQLVELAKYATIPVINGLTNEEHPCQVLADLLTIMDHRKMKHPKELRGFRLSYLGDGNNVAVSLVHAAAMLGVHVHIASPEGYQLPHSAVQQATGVSRFGARLRMFVDPADAVPGWMS